MLKWILRGIVLFLLFIVIYAFVRPVEGADNLTFCRNTDYAWVRLELHGVPDRLLDGGYWYVASGASMYGNVFVVDALEADSAPYVTGQAAFGYDNIEIVGDQNSPACDSGSSPAPQEPFDTNLSGEPGACYLAYMDTYLMTDDAHPDGIIWQADADGIVHIIGFHPDASYNLVGTACQ